MFTEETVISQIAVDDAGVVSVRRTHHVLRDGVRLAATHHRTTYEPGAALDTEATIVQKIAALVWTPEVIEANIARREAALAALLPPPQTQGDQP